MKNCCTVGSTIGLALLTAACSSTYPTQPSSAPVPTPSVPSPPIVISEPVLLSPVNRVLMIGWPTFTVKNAARSGSTGSIVYRFEIYAVFTWDSPIILTSTVPETPNQTSFTPLADTPTPVTTDLAWRVTTIDQTTGNSSRPSQIQFFYYSPNGTAQSLLATKLGFLIWPPAGATFPRGPTAVQPPGTTGHANLGNNWPEQWSLICDEIDILPEELRVFDLIDRGFDPQAAIDWMHSHGYATAAAYYPSKKAIGFATGYIALINGRWDRVDLSSDARCPGRPL